jgi:hypothetical protein
MPPEQRGPGQWRAGSAQKPVHSGRRSSLQASVPSHGANPGDAEACGPSLKSASAVGRLHGDSHVPNRTGEIPPSGMTRGDTGNWPRRGMRHRRVPRRSRSQLLPAADWYCACVLSQPGCGNAARPDPWRGLRVTVISTPTCRASSGAGHAVARTSSRERDGTRFDQSSRDSGLPGMPAFSAARPSRGGGAWGRRPASSARSGRPRSCQRDDVRSKTSALPASPDG